MFMHKTMGSFRKDSHLEIFTEQESIAKVQSVKNSNAVETKNRRFFKHFKATLLRIQRQHEHVSVKAHGCQILSRALITHQA